VRIVLDTDVVSLHRAGRLPARFSRHLVGNQFYIAFATAGELWKGALAARWGGARRGGLDLWLDQAAILPAGLGVARTWGALAATLRMAWDDKGRHPAATVTGRAGGKPLAATLPAP
jgi:predicted nucleic acid-binding protein